MKTYTVTFEKLQQAFVDGSITLEQFIEVLVDHFGQKRARKIIRKNLEIALEKERKSNGLD